MAQRTAVPASGSEDRGRSPSNGTQPDHAGKGAWLLAWYRVMRDAEGQVETKKIEITENIFDANRKPVASNIVVTAISQWEGELRECTNPARREAEDSIKVAHLEKMLPKTIRNMLQTVGFTSFKGCKEHVLEQARTQRDGKQNVTTTAALDIDLSEEEGEKKEEGAVTEDKYSNNEWLCWMGKGTPRKGGGLKRGKEEHSLATATIAELTDTESASAGRRTPKWQRRAKDGAPNRERAKATSLGGTLTRRVRAKAHEEFVEPRKGI